MKVKIMTTEAIEYVKKNIDSLIPYYKRGEQPEVWLKEKLGANCFIEVELEFEDFTLQVSEDKPSAEDVFNAKVMYENMKDLNDSFATDERLWAGLAHTYLYDYMLKRWPGYFEKNDILNHFFFNQGRPRCYFVNSLSRLWWFGRKTYNDNFANPWETLDYISRDLNGFGFTLFGSNWSNSSRTLELFMRANFKYTEITSKHVSRELFNEALQYTNCLSGIYVLDACEDDFVINNIYDYLIKRDGELELEKDTNKLKNIKTTGILKLDNLIRALNKLGGYGTLGEIFDAYASVTGEEISDAQKSYIKESLSKYYVDSSTYCGKSIFFKLTTDEKQYWKLGSDYLTVENYEAYNARYKDILDNLPDNEQIVFLTISGIKRDRFTLSDLAQFKQPVIQAHPEIENFDRFVKENVNALYRKGVLEKIDGTTYKKTYKLKNREIN